MLSLKEALRHSVTRLHLKPPFRNSPFRGRRRPVMGLNRETVNLWEQRSPLIPEHVRQLVQSGVRVIVQPSSRRCYLDHEFSNAGAEVQEDLSEANLILGVKRPSEEHLGELLADKTYAFFTHTIKAQADNMGMLDLLLERNIRMIDYECMVNQENRRLVAFGRYAGLAGTLDILNGIGLRLLALGYSNPFMQISMAHHYVNLHQAKQAVRLAGYDITQGRMPKTISPLIFVIHGDGNVAMGAKSILDCLPVRYIEPEQLEHVATHGDKNVVYVCVVNISHYMEHRKGGPFVMSDYLNHPEMYRSTFIDKIAPYTSVLINATYWDASVDRILTRENIKQLSASSPVSGSTESQGYPSLPHRLIAICDVSADPGGSVEFTDTCTTVDEPFVIYNTNEGTQKSGIIGDGILMCSIDNMPTQLPQEASEHFGNVLLPYLPDMLKSDALQPFNEYNARPEVKNAVITSNHRLTPKFRYIEDLRAHNKVQYKSTQIAIPGRRVLVLGAGYVVPSLVDYLSRDQSVKITVASNDPNELNEVEQKFPTIEPYQVNVLSDNKQMGALIEHHDLVISLIPWKFHPHVMEECIRHKRNILTASYYTPALREMEKSIEESGITAFMEIGLDPGIDHLLTKECIDEVKAKGGRLVSYRSYTGGLPAPEYSNNPLRYKFSWSPEAALSTVLNGAKYLENGQIREIPADGSLLNYAKPMDIFPGFNLEGYPNRDSTRYIDLYELEGCETVVRGTLRYSGFTKAMKFLIQVGLLDSQQHKSLEDGSLKMSWCEFICEQLELKHVMHGKDLEKAILEKTGGDRSMYECLNELGFLSDDPVAQTGTPLSSMAQHLSTRLSYGKSERDLIVMAHELIIDWPDRGQREQRKVSMVAYGKSGQGRSGLAMSQTVGLPAAIAAKMILDGEIKDTGVVLPLKPHIYKPILQRLQKEGISAQEVSTFYDLKDFTQSS